MTKSSGSQHAGSSQPNDWDHGTHDEFYQYYAEESLSTEAQERFRQQRDAILGIPQRANLPHNLDIADIGSGAGTLAMLWAELGHRVVGVDINEPLIELARKRAQEKQFDIRFEVGSATDLPLETGSVDVCFAPELLEHVADWRSCLAEFARVLRPGGILYVSTTNSLCPRQQEFNLPFYSWYPGPLKRHYERLAVTSRPEIANYAKYPAVNWFTFFGLRASLASYGFNQAMDRFDVAATKDFGGLKNAILKAIRTVSPLRFLAHVFSEGTTVVCIRQSDA